MMIINNNMPAGSYCCVCSVDIHGMQGITIFYEKTVADYCFPCAEKDIFFNNGKEKMEQAQMLELGRLDRETVKGIIESEKLKERAASKIRPPTGFLENTNNKLAMMDKAARQQAAKEEQYEEFEI